MRKINARALLFSMAVFVIPTGGHADDGHNAFVREARAYAAECAAGLTEPARRLDPTAESSFLQPISRVLYREVIDQEEAVESLLNGLDVALGGMSDPNRPFSRNLAIGPTGVGKTELMRALVLALGGDPYRDLIRIDCGEFQQGHEISKLIGATATYVGYGDTPLLHQSELDRHKVVLQLPNGQIRRINLILIDEIEKCAESVRRLALTILDDGVIKMGDGSRSDFRDSIIMATSNLGAKLANQAVVRKRKSLESRPLEPNEPKSVRDLTGRYDRALREDAEAHYLAALKAEFSPEFINRWMTVLFFHRLGPEQNVKILQKLLARVQKTIFTSGLAKAGLLIEPGFRESLVRRGTNEEYGARPLENLITKDVRAPFARLLTQAQVKEGDVVAADQNAAGGVEWRLIGQNLDRERLLKYADKAYPNFEFLNFDWTAAPAAAPESPRPPPSRPKYDAVADLTNAVLTLDSQKSALRHLYLDIPGPPIYMAYANAPAQSYPVKFVAIGKTTYRIRNADTMDIRVHNGPIPDAALPIHAYTAEEFRQLMIPPDQKVMP